MFEAQGLMVFYENMLALNNVSLQVDEGRIIGIFGANSAGKSTLMYSRLRHHPGYQTKGRDGRGGTDYGIGPGPV